MKKLTQLKGVLLASLSLAVLPILAQGPDAGAEFELAPNVKNFKELQKLDRQIVDMSKRAQPDGLPRFYGWTGIRKWGCGQRRWLNFDCCARDFQHAEWGDCDFS